MKKSRLITFAVVLVLILGILTFIFHAIHEWKYLTHDVGGDAIRDFKSYKKDFEIIAETVISFYDEEKEKNDELISITVDKLIDTWEVKCMFGTEKTDNYTLVKQVTQEEEQAYSFISGAFAQTDSRGLYFIKVMNDRVVFLSGTPYAIVYMRNEKRPKYILSEEEGYDSIFVDRLSSKWYQVKGK